MNTLAKVGTAIFFILFPLVLVIAFIGGAIMYIRYGDD